MKKLIAFLSVCAMITCTFASCGREETEESNEKSVSVSESEAETSETETETETEEDTTEVETTTEPVTEEETTEATTEKSSEDLVGMWYMENENGTFVGLDIKDDGKVDMFTDITETLHFTADGNVFIDGDVLPIDYDDKNLVITFHGEEIVNMTKDTGDVDSYDGEYTLLSGAIYDEISTDESYDIGFIVNGEMMFVDCRNIMSYTTSNDFISFKSLYNFNLDDNLYFDDAKHEYEVSGDTLTIFYEDKYESDIVLKKFDFATYKPSVKTSTESNTSVEKSTSVEKNTSTKNEVSTNETISDDNKTTDGSIIGMWLSPDDSSYGFNFEEDMTGGIFVDATEMAHFTTDGKFFISAMTLEAENIDYDGTTLTVSLMGTEILSMTRNDENNPDSFDGSYTFVSGSFYDGMVTSMCDSFGIDEEDAVLYAIVTGEQMYIEFAKIFEYSAEDGVLTVSGLENLDLPDGSITEYEFSDNKLIMTDPDGTSEIFEKIELS